MYVSQNGGKRKKIGTHQPSHLSFGHSTFALRAMGSDGNQGQWPDRSVDKGKGRVRADENIEDGKGQDQGAGSLFSSMMNSAKSSVTPSNLSSLVTANGKPSAGLPSSAKLSSQAFEGLQYPSAGSASSQSRLPPSGAFHQPDEASHNAHDNAYRQFADSAPPRFDMTPTSPSIQSSSSILVGPYSSAQSLDAPLHHYVRADSSHWSNMEESWKATSQTMSSEELTQLQDPAYHEAWARNIPAPMFGDQNNDLQQGEHLDRLLQSVSLSDQQFTPTHANGMPMDIMSLLDEEEKLGEPVLHDDGRNSLQNGEPLMSEEQTEMHRALDLLQNSEERADENIQPPDDDAAARSGVYAATPEDALRAIWDGTREGERASSIVRESQSTGNGGLSRKIKEILKRGSYVDDVYGIPPQLKKTLVEAEEAETEENKDRKAKAIRRLDALYRHLGAGSQSASSIDDFVKDW